MKKKIYILNGPNINMTGVRETDIYGEETLYEINAALAEYADSIDVDVEFYQYNSEGSIIDCLQDAHNCADGIILNAGAYTHYSYAIRDAIASIAPPVIEVHMSNIFARDQYRSHSVISDVCIGTISGFGSKSYQLAMEALVNWY